MLSKDLIDLLADNEVQEQVARWLADKNITKVISFADLADSKAEIVDYVARPAGVDLDDPVQCQPLRTAWKLAEAMAKLATDARAKGEDVDADYTMGSETRQRLDANIQAHYNFKWPASLQGDDSIMGKMSRFFSKKLRWTPTLNEVKSILERGEHAPPGAPVDIGGVFDGVDDSAQQIASGEPRIERRRQHLDAQREGA